MMDFEDIRTMQMVEERIEYENDFISFSDIQKSEEMDFQIAEYQFFTERFEENHVNDIYHEDIDREFDSEDYLFMLRDEQLIEERLSYEENICQIPSDEIIIMDDMDAQIDSLDEPEDYDFYYDYDFDDCYFEEIPMDASYSCGQLNGYVVSDDPFDRLDYCDYPEGPSENIEGFRYPEPDYSFDFIDDDYDILNCRFEEPEDENDYGLSLYEMEMSNMDHLIEKHLKEEELFFDFIRDNEVEDNFQLQFEGDDIILC